MVREQDFPFAAGPLEQALGLLATLLLRNPTAAELAAESGCIDSCAEAMHACEAGDFKDSAVGSQWVLRQVLHSVPSCQAARLIYASQQANFQSRRQHR